jgi:hypothetical protein
LSLRTSTPSKSRKIKFAVSGLALAAAAAGTIGMWPSSAAGQPAASASQGRPTAQTWAPTSQAQFPQAHTLQPAAATPPEAAGYQAAVLDSLTASVAQKAVTAHKPAHHRKRRHHRAVRLTPRQIARRMLRSFHWSGWQFQWLNLLWSRESSWNVYASNPYSGAYGIPQAVPGSKMASAGPDWERSARTQIRWGMDYIKERYGSPHGAWEHELATGWY